MSSEKACKGEKNLKFRTPQMGLRADQTEQTKLVNSKTMEQKQSN